MDETHLGPLGEAEAGAALIVAYEAELEEQLSWDLLRLLVDLGFGYALVTVSEVLADVREQEVVYCFEQIWEAMVMVQYHGVVRYLVYEWVVLVLVDGEEVVVYVHVPKVKVAGRVLLLISLMMC